MLIRKELKDGLMGFLVWTVITCVLFGLIFLLYPSIIENMDADALDAMLAMFPESVLKAFNMDISGISSAFGWLKSEGFVFILLVTGAYSALLGGNIVLKEENDHTIEYLNSLPVSRTEILLKKFIAGLLYVIAFVLVTALSNYAFLALTEEPDTAAYWTLAVTPLFSSVVLYSVMVLLSTFMHRSRAMTGLSLGIVFAGYILNMFASLSEVTEFLKYISVFTLADIRHVIVEGSIQPVMVIVTVVISVLSLLGSLAVYRKKDLL